MCVMRVLVIRRILLGATLLVAVSAMAYRREYSVTWAGQRKAGSEVCFYRGVRGDPFTLFFTSSEVRCLSADSILDFPPGLIHVFARHQEGFASRNREYTVYDGPPDPERGYQKLETPLVRAGTVDFAATLKALRGSQHVGVWVGSTPASMGTFIPLVKGERTILAPAEVTIVPLVVDGGMPVMIGEPLYLEPGEKQTATFKPQAETSDVVVWTRLDGGSSEAVAEAPDITITSGGQILRPLVPLYGHEANTLLIFRGVPPGKAVLTARGSMWKRVTREVNVPAQPVTIEREAVPLEIGGSVIVRWSTEGAQSQHSDCSAARTADVPLVRAALLHCTAAEDGKKKCSAVAQTTAAYESNSSLNFDGAPAGQYTLMIEPPYGKRQSLTAEVAAAHQTNVDVTFPSFNFFGTVTVNGKPVHARLIFFTGQAVSDAEGRYNATLAVDPRAEQIRIEPCEEHRGFRYIPPTGPAANAAFDLDVRLAKLEVRVTDPQHHPVAGASVYFSPIKDVQPNGRAAMYFGSDPRQTDDHGEAAFDDVPRGFLVGICAAHKEFVTKCSDPFDLTKLGESPAVVQFDPVATRGRVAGHSGDGYVETVNATGIVTEDVRVGADGTFLFRLPHSAPEHLVYVSESRPLTVLPLPLAPPADLLIQVPAVPVRTFTVTVPNNKNDFGSLGIWIGGMYVPVDVFNTHMELRGLDSVIHRGASLRVPDIAETGPITVAFGVQPQGAKTFVDPFTLPQYAGVARIAVKTNEVALPQ